MSIGDITKSFENLEKAICIDDGISLTHFLDTPVQVVITDDTAEKRFGSLISKLKSAIIEERELFWVKNTMENNLNNPLSCLSMQCPYQFMRIFPERYTFIFSDKSGKRIR